MQRAAVRRRELEEAGDSESNCRCSEETRRRMFTESLTPWKSQQALAQVQAGPERTHTNHCGQSGECGEREREEDKTRQWRQTGL